MAATKTLRSILRELRMISPDKTIKKYETTDEQLCKEKDEMHFLAKTYLCYLESSRNYKRINDDYRGAGERSVEDTAKMVGFKLPHDPK